MEPRSPAEAQPAVAMPYRALSFGGGFCVGLMFAAAVAAGRFAPARAFTVVIGLLGVIAAAFRVQSDPHPWRNVPVAASALLAVLGAAVGAAAVLAAVDLADL